MLWIRKSKKCQIKRIRRRVGVVGCRVARERRWEVTSMARTAERETMVVVSRWSIMDPVPADAMFLLEFRVVGAWFRRSKMLTRIRFQSDI